MLQRNDLWVDNKNVRAFTTCPVAATQRTQQQAGNREWKLPRGRNNLISTSPMPSTPASKRCCISSLSGRSIVRPLPNQVPPSVRCATTRRTASPPPEPARAPSRHPAQGTAEKARCVGHRHAPSIRPHALPELEGEKGRDHRTRTRTRP